MKTVDPRKRKILESLKKGLIVSCQVQHDDPIYSEEMPALMAKAAQWGRVVGIRANTPEQIRTIKAAVDLPVIGLYKQWEQGTDSRCWRQKRGNGYWNILLSAWFPEKEPPRFPHRSPVTVSAPPYPES